MILTAFFIELGRHSRVRSDSATDGFEASGVDSV
jgi:hypothetical protein